MLFARLGMMASDKNRPNAAELLPPQQPLRPLPNVSTGVWLRISVRPGWCASEICWESGALIILDPFTPILAGTPRLPPLTSA